jgi:hypothetical protein
MRLSPAKRHSFERCQLAAFFRFRRDATRSFPQPAKPGANEEKAAGNNGNYYEKSERLFWSPASDYSREKPKRSYADYNGQSGKDASQKNQQPPAWRNCA